VSRPDGGRSPTGSRPRATESTTGSRSSAATSVAVVVALIGAVATIIAAVIGLFKPSDSNKGDIAQAVIQMTAVSYSNKPPPPAINVSGRVLNSDDPTFQDEIIYVIARPVNPTANPGLAPASKKPSDIPWYASDPVLPRLDHSWDTTVLISGDVDGPFVVQTIAVPKCGVECDRNLSTDERGGVRSDESREGVRNGAPPGHGAPAAGRTTTPQPPPEPSTTQQQPGNLRDLVIQNGNKIADYQSNTQLVTPSR